MDINMKCDDVAADDRTADDTAARALARLHGAGTACRGKPADSFSFTLVCKRGFAQVGILSQQDRLFHPPGESPL